MKIFMILGGLFGFVIGLACSWAEQNSWPTILWHASAAAYLTGLLLRWWGRVWINGLYQAATERLAAEAALESPATSTPTKR